MTAEGGVATGWRVVGRSVRGASHVRSGLPNQDAMGWLPESGAGLPLIVAVSDGHGSAKSFRSDYGARFAVDVVKAELGVLLEEGGALDAAAVKRLADERLAEAVVRRWRDTAEAHLLAQPFSAAELEALHARDGASGRARLDKNPLLAYGATVLGVLVGHGFLLYLQLGDGDIVTVGERGEVGRPMPRDERLMGNETTSLCAPDAARELRVVFRPSLAEAPPALILVSSDGYANSFRDEAGFLRVGPDVLEMVCESGVDQVAGEIEGWLEDASRVGSGDDITLALVVRESALPSARHKLERAVTAPPLSAPPDA